MGNKKETKKSSLVLINEAQDFLLNDFINSLKGKDNKPLQSRKQYRQVVNALSVDDAFTSSKTKNFMELLLKLLAIQGRKDDCTTIKELIADLEDDVKEYDWKKKGKKSYKTYINRFISFLRYVIDNENERLKYKNTNLKMDPASVAALDNTDGELYLHNILFTKFKSRLRCQDRISGQKIWLPLRFIAKLYTKDDTGKKDSRFSNWLDSLVNGICIHYNDEGVIKHVKFGDKEDISLLLLKNTKGKYDVHVRWYDGKELEEFPVLSPTGRGNEKVRMVVEKISDIAIDHVKPIDQTLKEKANELTELEKVSEFYKDLVLQEGKDPTNADAESLRNDTDLNLVKLIEDLKKIRDDSPLRLMSAEYNSNKSNGDTFKEIRQVAEDNYVGILLEGIRKDSDDNEEYILYQKLTNIITENGVMRIRAKKDEIEGEKVESKDYLEIIDLI